MGVKTEVLRLYFCSVYIPSPNPCCATDFVFLCLCFYVIRGCVFSRQLFLPSMRKKSGLSTAEGSVDGDTLTAHWFVDDMYTFENVGFTKDVGRIKYLICADCEIGPIGWHCLDDKKSFYVAVERVNHA